MKRQISYDEQALKDKITYIDSLISEIDNEVEMMEEQAIGLRDNLDWMSSSKTLRDKLENLKEQINRFGCRQLPYDSSLQSRYNCFNEYHMRLIQDRFAKNTSEAMDLY